MRSTSPGSADRQAEPIDLDHNATTRLGVAARAAMQRVLDDEAAGRVGNPSSIHTAGRAARQLVEVARRQVAGALGAAPLDVVFTASGSEADTIGVLGLARAARAAGRPARVIASPLEHPAVLGALEILGDEGFEVVLVPVGANGAPDEAAYAAALAPGAALVALALANHELGTLAPLPRLAAAAHAAGAHVHCDAVQALGKVPVDVAALGADTVAVSAHKIHGPRGAGALWVRQGVPLARLAGGHQERGRRPGTENVAAIVGFGAAALEVPALLAEAPRVRMRRDRLEQGVLALGGRVLGGDATRVGNTCAFGFRDVPGDVLVAALDLAGFAISAGAACSSGRVIASAAALALGEPEAHAKEVVRVSLGVDSTDAHVDAFVAALPAVLARIRAAGV